MSHTFSDFGIQPEQGPPLTIPLAFFVMAPLAVAAAGLILLSHDFVFVWRGLPATLAIVHLATLGFLTSVMLGASYQILPVVGSPVPLVRMGHLVHLFLVAGVIALVWAFLRGQPGMGEKAVRWCMWARV